MWFDCASSNDDVPPTVEELEVFLDEMDEDTRKRIYHRFVLTRRGNQKFLKWLGGTFFFRNATADQLQTLRSLYSF